MATCSAVTGSMTILALVNSSSRCLLAIGSRLASITIAVSR